jgi:hypothetical protein
VAIRGDGSMIATGARDGRIVVVKPAKGKLLAQLTAHTGCITAMRFASGDSVLASASRDGTLRVWPTEYIASGVALHTVRVPNNSEILACAVSTSDRIAAVGCGDGTVYLISLASSRQLHAIPVSNVAVQAVEFSSSSEYLTIGCADGCTALVETDTCVGLMVGGWGNGCLRQQAVIHDVWAGSRRCMHACYTFACIIKCSTFTCFGFAHCNALYLIHAEITAHTRCELAKSLHAPRRGVVLRRLIGNAEGVHATFFPSGSGRDGLNDMLIVSLCSRQAICWDVGGGTRSSTAEFLADEQVRTFNGLNRGLHEQVRAAQRQM